MPYQPWPAIMSTSTNNHISSLRICWQPLHRRPTNPAAITNKSGNNNHRENHPRPTGNYLEIEAKPPWFSASYLHDQKATSKRWNSLGRIGSAKNRPKTTKQEKGHQEASRPPKTTKIDGGWLITTIDLSRTTKTKVNHWDLPSWVMVKSESRVRSISIDWIHNTNNNSNKSHATTTSDGNEITRTTNLQRTTNNNYREQPTNLDLKIA